MVPVRRGEASLGTHSSEALLVGPEIHSEEQIVSANDRSSAFDFRTCSGTFLVPHRPLGRWSGFRTGRGAMISAKTLPALMCPEATSRLRNSEEGFRAHTCGAEIRAESVPRSAPNIFSSLDIVDFGFLWWRRPRGWRLPQGSDTGRSSIPRIHDRSLKTPRGCRLLSGCVLRCARSIPSDGSRPVRYGHSDVLDLGLPKFSAQA